jgi:histidyl-tRNA synthetase
MAYPMKGLRGVANYSEAQIVKIAKMAKTIEKEFSVAGYINYSPPPFEDRDVILKKGGINSQVYSVTRVVNEGDDTETRFCLPFDRTVPFSAFIARHEREICYPIKRYDISPSFRGENPQKGRLSVFTQADLDVIGDNYIGIQSDIEVFTIIFKTLQKLKVGKFQMHLNDMRIIRAILAYFGIPDEKEVQVLRLIDKLAKVDQETIVTEIESLALFESEKDCIAFVNIFAFKGSIDGFTLKFKILSNYIKSELDGLQEIFEGMTQLGIDESSLIFSPMIARGLNYYSGAVFETFLDELPSLGSVASGGRYDDLASHFTKSKHPGVGGSIGLTRIFDFVISSNRVDQNKRSDSKVLVGFRELKLTSQASSIAQGLRELEISTDLYSGLASIKKQLTYSNKKGIPTVVLVMDPQVFLVKNLLTGKQKEIVNINEISKTINELS